ncbi:heat shock protein Hsp18 [Streptomyces lydicamycinicus]|uniref:Heat shock protein Hsp18 n=1 Tax=Streptomyces lydicamycinicus TaxID=1546107 RepID=A0A0P4RH26_9ACTN|nr:heat shock protein Hsp18 [Streptomyces lydicamycinicus]
MEPAGNDPDAGKCWSAGRRAERRPAGEADHEAGVLRSRTPIAERAEPHEVAMGGDTGQKQIRG